MVLPSTRTEREHVLVVDTRPWIAFVVVDGREQPAVGYFVELDDPASERQRLDASGRATFDGLQLAAAADTSVFAITEPQAHVVAEGDHLVRLAYRSGWTDPLQLWDRPENDSLRRLRSDPGVLGIGDHVRIPVPEPFVFPGLALDQEHALTLDLPVPSLRLELRHFSNAGYASIACGVAFDGKASMLETGDAGALAFEIGVDTAEVRLEYADQVLMLEVGTLPPGDTFAGGHARLENLGYAPGPRQGDGVEDEYAFRSAVEEFQCDYGLKVDGRMGTATREKLVEVHGA